MTKERNGEHLPEGCIWVAPGISMTAPTAGLTFANRDYATTYELFAAYETADGHCFLDYDQSTDPMGFVGTRRKHGYSRIHMAAVKVGTRAYDGYTLAQHAARNPWRDMPFWMRNPSRWIEHFVAPSDTVPGLLAYYQTPAKRAADIRTPIKPGRYLRRFFSDILSEDEIQTMGLAWAAAFAPAVLTVTQDADEIENVYRSVHHGSCMHFGEGHWSGSCHPARVYAGPDLGIAYIGTAEANAARCLVWPTKKIFLADKMYGDYHRLTSALEAAGFTAASDRSFTGARIQRIENCGGFTVPYSDTHDSATDDGDYLILDDGGDVDLGSTSGRADAAERYQCEDCGDGMDEDDQYYVDSVERSVCEHCYGQNYTRCDIMDEAYPDSAFVSSVEGTSISEAATTGRHSHRVFYCEGTELWYPSADYDYVVTADGTAYETGYFERQDGAACAFDEEMYLGEDLTTLDDGRKVASDHLTRPSATFTEWLEGAAVLGRDESPAQIELPLSPAFLPGEPTTIEEGRARLDPTYGAEDLRAVIAGSRYRFCWEAAQERLDVLERTVPEAAAYFPAGWTWAEWLTVRCTHDLPRVSGMLDACINHFTDRGLAWDPTHRTPVEIGRGAHMPATEARQLAPYWGDRAFSTVESRSLAELVALFPAAPITGRLAALIISDDIAA